MIRRIFFIGLLGCYSINLSAQDSRYIDSLVNWINTHPTVDSQYIHTLHRLSYRYSEHDIRKSYYYYQRVSQLSDSMNFTFGKSLAQINLGLLLFSSASFDASNRAFFRAIDYAEQCGSLRLKSVALNNIGDNFLSLRNYDKSRQYTSEAIPINIELIKKWGTRGVAINYELLFRCDFNQKLYSGARANLNKGLPYAITADENYIFSQYDLDFGKLAAIDNKLDSARYYFNKSVKEAQAEHDLRNEFEAYLGKAQYLQNISSADKITLLDSALGIAKNTGYYEGISNAAEQLSIVYDRMGKTDSALEYFRLYRASFDSLFSQNTSLNLVISESDRVVQKKELENKHLQQVAALQKEQLIFRDALLFASFILLLAIVVAGFFINKSIQSKKTRSESALKQKIAESQIQSLRAQMNPHFIFNSLNSIENFMMQNEKRKASDYLHKFALLMRIILESSRNEITTVALDIEALNLYIDLEQMRFNNMFSYHENIDPQLLSDDYNVPSLLVQPYVENAIVHGIAHSDRKDLQLTVTATLEKDYIRYVIEDNGIGRKQAQDYNKMNKLHHKSFGLKITEDRIKLFNHEEILNGDIKIIDLYNNNQQPDGTRVEVKIKVL